MTPEKQRRLAAAGWKVGSTKEFLKLSAEESAIIELRLLLAEQVRVRRIKSNLSQHALAKKLASSQSRVAKMEAGDASVSIDLLIRGLLALGATRQELGRIISRKTPSPAA